jgi:uncharacterized repeat protein (TIGR03803 family)
LKGGVSNSGVIFSLATDGSEYGVLRSFSGLDGANPGAGVLRIGDMLYGTTIAGGISNNGVLFVLPTKAAGQRPSATGH